MLLALSIANNFFYVDAEGSTGFVTGANSTTFTIGTDVNVNQSTTTYLQ